MSVLLERITKSNHSELISILKLYEDTFPFIERRNLEQLKYLIENQTQMYFCAIRHNTELAGFFIYWDLDGAYYFEHFAIFEQLRNQKIGLQVLRYAAEHLSGIRLLEVEPSTNEMNTKRIAYYERNGYQILTKDYVQPPYDLQRNSKEIQSLWIMGSEQTDKLDELLFKIKKVVYENNYNWENEVSKI